MHTQNQVRKAWHKTGEEKTLNLPEAVGLAYIAGLLDGEGHIAVHSNRPVVSIGNTDYKMIEYLLGVYNQVYYCKRSFPHKDCWEWSITHSKFMEPFLEAVRPYLITKAEAADDVLSILRFKKKARSREGLGGFRIRLSHLASLEAVKDYLLDEAAKQRV